MTAFCKEVADRLAALADPAYRDFHAKLIPNVPKERILGVRTPQIRALAKALFAHPNRDEFLNNLPHSYYEENNLHAALLERMRSFPDLVRGLDAFFPYMDNWATCDLCCPHIAPSDLPLLDRQCKIWMQSQEVFAVRFAIRMRMNYFLDEAFVPPCLAEVAAVSHPAYYVRMMVAWYFATALAKQYPFALPYLEERRLDPFTHNRTIQKARESFRISPAEKAYLATLRIPGSHPPTQQRNQTEKTVR